MNLDEKGQSGFLSMRIARGRIMKSPIAFVCVVVSICCLFVMTMSVFKLPEVSLTGGTLASFRPKKLKKVLGDSSIGKFGKMIIEMLPEDLAFTVFLPSERAFERDLRLDVNDSLKGEKFNDTYAILTRILGFSVVPRRILSVYVPLNEESMYDSISGFSLYLSKDLDGKLAVNRIRSKQVDLKKGEIVVHIMDGVIMDAEFEQSVQPDNNEKD